MNKLNPSTEPQSVPETPKLESLTHKERMALIGDIMQKLNQPSSDTPARAS